MNEPCRFFHTFGPVYDQNSRILILGSFPSVKSREQSFYYGHPQNRFWPLLSTLLKESLPQTIPDKRRMLLTHGIALWDVIESCTITGSSDSSIRDAEVNDFSLILKKAPIANIFANGAKAYDLYQKYAYPLTGRCSIKLPSTSPANAAWNMERLLDAWGVILEDL